MWISCKKLVLDQIKNFYLMSLSVLITSLLDNVWILLGEVTSDLEAKELHHLTNWIELDWAMKIHLRENSKHMSITMKYLNHYLFKTLTVWYIVYTYWRNVELNYDEFRSSLSMIICRWKNENLCYLRKSVSLRKKSLFITCGEG